LNPNVNQSVNQPLLLLLFVCDGMQQYGVLTPVLAGLMDYMEIMNLECRKIKVLFVVFFQHCYHNIKNNQYTHQ